MESPALRLPPRTRSTIAAELGALAAVSRRSQPLADRMRAGCWIYGAGQYGQLIHRMLLAKGVTCHGFVDQRAAEPAFAATLAAPAIHPNKLGHSVTAAQPLIVALHNFATDQRPVVAWARRAGFAEVIVPAELPDLLGQEAGSYWLTGRDHTINNIDAVLDLIDLLDDKTSVDTVRRLARFRISGEVVEHPEADISDQYFPRDLNFAFDRMRLVDGGAFTGDALESAAAAGIAIDEWYAFEPDPANFAQLASNAARAPHIRASLFPCGLGNTLEQLRFTSGQEAGSRAEREGGGDMIVQIVPFDLAMPNAAPTHVKLDIEGYEREALHGMTRMLSRVRPRLAISIYHKPEDLWELPFLARDLLPDASLHIRQHGFNGFDTVLYVVPR